MALSRVMNLRTFAFIIIAFVLATVAYGFAASNTVPATGAGDGSEAISGYTVSDVTYELADDPTAIGSVDFTLTPQNGAGNATDVRIALTSSGSWFECTESGTSISCDVEGSVTVANAGELRVVAVQ